MDKVAVVTGASYGLGYIICQELLKSGFKVYGISRSKPDITDDNFTHIKADLSENSGIKKAAESINSPKVDLLVNNAAVAFTKEVKEYTDEDFEKIYGLNVKSPVKLTVSLLGKLKNSLIINISSTSDRYPDKYYGLYGSSKAALNLLFETLAEENPSLKVLNILPSYIDTPMLRNLIGKENFDWNMSMSADEVAKAVTNIIKNSGNLESGSRIIIGRNYTPGQSYNPEKLWLYSTGNNNLTHIN